MREIKFRYIFKGGRTIFVTLDCLQDSAISVMDMLRKKHGMEISRDEFTGLRDKNGKEIYEGDIVLHKYIDGDKKIAEVVFIPGCFTLYFKQHGIYPMAMKLEDNEDIYEIIGNIHETPELLNPSGREG